MNCKEWRTLKRIDHSLLNWDYYNNTRKIQKSLQYNQDPNAIVIHHLRDTEEQRKYNDEHYELWGFNEDGTFEYGKYIVFVTKEDHSKIHKCSEETRKKISNSNKGKYVSEETKKKMSEAKVGHDVSDETRKKISESETGKIISEETRKKISKSCKGHTPPNKGVPHSAETRKKISENTRAAMTSEARRKCSEAHKGLKPSEETKRKMSNSAKARINDEFRDKMRNLQYKRLQDDTYRQFLKDTAKQLQSLKSSMYKEYKAGGGTLSWNEFQKYIKDNNLLNKYSQGDSQCLFHVEEE